MNQLLLNIWDIVTKVIIHTWMRLLIAALLLALVLNDCAYDPNKMPTLEGKLNLLKEVPNGQKFLVGDLASTDYLYVAKLKGTPYEMGYAYGQLFKEEIEEQLKVFFQYLEDEIKGNMAKFVPQFMLDKAAGGAMTLIKKLLWVNVLITKRYTNVRYEQEIKGIAKGAGVKAIGLQQVNILPELIKAACTVAGLWGPATANGNTLHMRALDWDNKFPINKFPVATVYLPSNASLHPHVNFAWVGFVGSLTGLSDKISLGEKVWLPPKHSVPMTRYGNPWTYVFRDVLYEANNLKDAINILQNTHRTCAIHIGIGSVDDQSFRMLEYSYKTLNVYDDKNYNYTVSHPKIEGVAYFDKHVQPSKDNCMATLLKTKGFAGNWDIDAFWRVVGQSHKTGDTQLVVFDLETGVVYISYSQVQTGTEAYKRRPIRLETADLFAKF